MFGFPGEKISDIYETLSLVDKIKDICPKAFIGFNAFYPTPRTPAFRQLEENGEELPKTLEEFRQFNYLERLDPKVLDIYFTSYMLFFILEEKGVYYRPQQKLFNLLKPYLLFKFKRKKFGNPIGVKLTQAFFKPGH